MWHAPLLELDLAARQRVDRWAVLLETHAHIASSPGHTVGELSPTAWPGDKANVHITQSLILPTVSVISVMATLIWKRGPVDCDLIFNFL